MAGKSARGFPARAAAGNAGVRAREWALAAAAGCAVGLCLGFADRLRPSPPRTAAPNPALAVDAASPRAMPAATWMDILVQTWSDFSRDQITSVAGGVTFFGLLALFPALSAFVSLYGLVADVQTARRQIDSLAGLLPGGAVSVLTEQITRLTQMNHAHLGAAFAVSLLLSLWSSNAGVKALIFGLNVAYEEHEKRNFVRLNLVSLAFTAGVTVFMLAAVASITAVPALLSALGYGAFAGLSLLRWPALLVIVTGLLSLLYRYGPSRTQARWRWISPGGAASALAWICMSLLFSWYAANFGSYDRTYGSLGAVVGFMTWIWLSIIVVLFGAELNSEIEKHTRVDTTTGPARPAGRRGAAVADHLAQRAAPEASAV